MSEKIEENSLATEPIGKLVFKFALPAIISTLVGAIYNMVDQIFVGRGVGVIGNAATNVSFPLTTIFTAISLLIGVGTAANFNLRMGEKRERLAQKYIGNGVVLMVVMSIVFSAVSIMFITPLLKIFGATEEVMPYAKTYASIICIGFPFLVLNTASSNIIRADGSPKYAMVCVVVGAVINTILDPIFIFVFKWGMAGAAWATVIGQIASAAISIYYLKYKFKTFTITKEILKVHSKLVGRIFALGASISFNQVAMLIMQITLNNVLAHYGALSKYGPVIPLAVVGIIFKVNFIFLSVSVGVGQGCQPIFGYNYGARNYKRVEDTLKLTTKINLIVGTLALISFQLFPREIISFFGTGNKEYFEFGTRFFRIFMMFTITNGLMPLFGNFFASIGKPIKGIFVTLTRQFLFLVPLLIILPMIFGIEGIMFAGPIADFAALVVALALALDEIKKMRKLALEN
ncbi:MATE family efflux transporter [Miniphocaeibacter halophilus]|uniref:MATE family efflux transporter n=1 Tax=Miniphocaeibacter halophilus TaxID=2931922 RepID=A0AC61MT30_9FIRM|nr:MATE family efflux transporter [Miniphocaeibacter halophilus]QQK08874.1 MATE family efflux transporter [Miniphocaeibacter halophilus]